MATLQVLRNKAGILVSIAIGLALLAFILTDLLTSGENVFGGSNQVVADVDGETVSIHDYQNLIDEYETFQKLNSRGGSLGEEESAAMRENVWNQMVQNILMDKKYEDAGISVTAEELFDMAAGSNIHTTIRQMFSDPQTGMFDKNMVINFLKNKNNDPQASFYWSFMEKQIIQERLFSKYATLVKKSLYCTNDYATFEANANAKEVDFAFVGVPYTAIPDSAIEVSNSEIKKRYNDDKKLYKVEASRDIEYVSFEVKPTEIDRQATFDYLEKQMDVFGKAETDAYEYVQKNAENPAIEHFVSKEQLSPMLQNFVANAKTNDLVGPYREGDVYKLTRLVSVAQRPDSVKARHILVRNNDKLADSLFSRLTSGGEDFATLARRYSEDNGSAINGGDLGWFADGAMVPAFNDACFNNAKGAIVKVQSQFGTHIINVQDKGVYTTKYSLATIDRTIDYSSKTYQAKFDEATRFASQNTDEKSLNAAIDTLNLVRRYGRNIKSSDNNIGALKQARDVVKWAYEAKVNQVSPLFSVGDQFVVAILVKSQEKGFAEIEEVSPMIARDIRNEKKAEQILASVNGKDLAAVAAEYNQKVDTANHISFSAYQVPGAGIEPALVGKSNVLAQGQEASVKGNNGVYVLNVTAEKAGEANVEAAKAGYNQANYGVEYQLMQLVRNNANIEDYRLKFY